MRKRTTSSSRRTTVRKAQGGDTLAYTNYKRNLPGVQEYTERDYKNPFVGRGMAKDSAAFENQPMVSGARKRLAELKGMPQRDFEAMARRDRAEVDEDLRRMKEREAIKKGGTPGGKQRRGGKTAIKKSAVASRMKAKAGKKVVATKKAKTGARTSYKRK